MMYKNSVTIYDVMSWEPHGHDGENDGVVNTIERVTALFAGRETVTALDVLDWDIDSQDKMWLITQGDILPQPVTRHGTQRPSTTETVIYPTG